MEFFFISLFIIFLVLEYGENLRNELLHALKTNHKGVIKYLGSSAVLSLTLTVLPGMMLTIYMRHHGFFAYEVFGEQQHAFQILSANVFLNFLIVSIYLFLPFLLWASNAGKAAIIASSIAPIIVIIFLIALYWSTGNSILIYSVLFLCTVVGGSLILWVRSDYNQKARYWMIPLGLSLLLIIGPILFFSSTVTFTENALMQMRVGGFDVELAEPLDFNVLTPNKSLKGKLLLRTPEFYYIKPASNPESIVILRSEKVSMRYLDKVAVKPSGASSSMPTQ